MLIQNLKFAHHLLCGANLAFIFPSFCISAVFPLPPPPPSLVYGAANLPASGRAHPIWKTCFFHLCTARGILKQMF